MIVAFLFIGAYFPVLKGLAQAWYGSEDYSHGFFIIPISMYVAWRSRDALAKVEVRGSGFGLILVILFLTIYLVSYSAEIKTLESSSMIFSLTGLVWYLLGPGYVRALAFPLILLFFMIPVPAQVFSSLTIPLQLLVSKISIEVARLMGISVLREGNVIHLPRQTLEVVQACSGLRSLMSLLTLSTVFGYLTLNSNLLRGALVLTAVPVAILVNIVRVTVIILALYFFNFDLVSGSLHTLTGVCIFLLSLIIIMATRGVFSIWDISTKAN